MSIGSIHVGLSGILKRVGTLIKLFRQFMSQKFFRVFVNSYIKITYENEVTIGFAMFINVAV